MTYAMAVYNVFTYVEEEVIEKKITYKKLSLAEGSYTPPCHFGIPQKGGVTLQGTFRIGGIGGEEVKRQPIEVGNNKKGMIKEIARVNGVRYKSAKEEADNVLMTGNELVEMAP